MPGGNRNLTNLQHTKARTAQQTDPNNKKNRSFLFDPGINFDHYPVLAPLLLTMLHMPAPASAKPPVQNPGMSYNPPVSGVSNYGLGFQNTTTSCPVSAHGSAANTSSAHTPIKSCLFFKPTAKAQKIYAKTPDLEEKDKRTVIKIMGKIQKTKSIGCKIKELCKGENITIKFSHQSELPQKSTIALSSAVDRSISVQTNLKDNLPNKQTFVHESQHLWVARRNRNKKMYFVPKYNASVGYPHAPGQESIFDTKTQMGLDRLKRLLKLLDNPSPMRPFNEQEQKDWDKLEKIKKIAAKHYTPHTIQLTATPKGPLLKQWVKKGHLDKNFRMVSRGGFEFTAIYDESESASHFVTSIVPLTPKKGTPKENYKYKVSIRTVRDLHDRVRAALKDGIWMLKQHIPASYSDDPTQYRAEVDANLRELYEYTSDSIPEGEPDSNIFPILFEELHAHELEEGGEEFRSCLRI